MVGRQRCHQRPKKTLSLFGALLGYRKPPKYFGLDNTISYGISASGPDNDVVFGPLVLYRPGDNTLVWIDQSFSKSDREQMEFFRSVATGPGIRSSNRRCGFSKAQN